MIEIYFFMVYSTSSKRQTLIQEVSLQVLKISRTVYCLPNDGIQFHKKGSLQKLCTMPRRERKNMHTFLFFVFLIMKVALVNMWPVIAPHQFV
jgi:hypothetical protein